MIQDRTSVFPKAFTELTFGLSDVLNVAPFTFCQVYKIFGVARYGVGDFSSFVGCNIHNTTTAQPHQYHFISTTLAILLTTSASSSLYFR